MANNSRYLKMFDALQSRGEIAWVPFVMLGYPDMETSIKVIQCFIDNGADALELGIPFSDPVADGVLIQDTARIALENGSTVANCMQALKQIRDDNADIPFGLLTYANLVYRPGLDNFYQTCNQVGVDSVLIADLPLIESKPFVEASNSANVDAIFIAPPNASDETLSRLSQQQGAYTYVVSRAGVTGDNKSVEYPVRVINSLLANEAPAPILGFGISQPQHVAKAVQLGFKGAISGSAISRMILDSVANERPLSELLEQLKSFSLTMKQATRIE